mmetsp:Transcript_11326/g.31558  ORF Transcript_11326/g.31558 Transcript_11326/m.31558 type:complete len:241 (-) Transcript_11326:238-960(-)
MLQLLPESRVQLTDHLAESTLHHRNPVHLATLQQNRLLTRVRLKLKVACHDAEITFGHTLKQRSVIHRAEERDAIFQETLLGNTNTTIVVRFRECQKFAPFHRRRTPCPKCVEPHQSHFAKHLSLAQKRHWNHGRRATTRNLDDDPPGQNEIQFVACTFEFEDDLSFLVSLQCELATDCLQQRGFHLQDKIILHVPDSGKYFIALALGALRGRVVQRGQQEFVFRLRRTLTRFLNFKVTL